MQWLGLAGLELNSVYIPQLSWYTTHDAIKKEG